MEIGFQRVCPILAPVRLRTTQMLRKWHNVRLDGMDTANSAPTQIMHLLPCIPWWPCGSMDPTLKLSYRTPSSRHRARFTHLKERASMGVRNVGMEAGCPRIASSIRSSSPDLFWEVIREGVPPSVASVLGAAWWILSAPLVASCSPVFTCNLACGHSPASIAACVPASLPLLPRYTGYGNST